MPTEAAMSTAAGVTDPGAPIPFQDWIAEGTDQAPPSDATATATDEKKDVQQPPAEPSPEAETKPDAEPDDKPPIETAPEGDEPAPAKAEADDEPESPPKAEQPPAPVVEFGENEPFDTFLEKVGQYKEAYVLPKEFVAITDGFEKQIATLESKVTDEVALTDQNRATVEAVEQLNDFEKDEKTGIFEPNAAPLVSHLRANYDPTVSRRVAFELMMAPSAKYGHLGFNILHEYFIDAGVHPARVEEFRQYCSGEATPPPLYPNLPEGVPQEYAEAYAKSASAQKIIAEASKVLAWSDIDKEISDPDGTLFKVAQVEFNDAIDGLKERQEKLDGDRQKAANDAAAQAKARQDFGNKVFAGVTAIQLAELKVTADTLSEKLKPFIPDKTARALQVLTYKHFIATALADDPYGEDARAELKANTINLEITKARTAIKQIQDAVEKREGIVLQTGDEKAADKAIQKDLTAALKELGVIRRRALGKLVQIITKSYAAGSDVQILNEDRPEIRPMLRDGQGRDNDPTKNVRFTDPDNAGKHYFNVFSGELNQ